MDRGDRRSVRRVAMDRVNETLAVIAAARALLAAPVGDSAARRRLREALEEYDGGASPAPR